MKVYIVLRCNEATFHNDWDALNYYTDMNIVGVFTTLTMAQNTIPNSIWTKIWLENGVLEFGKMWRYVAFDNPRRIYYIVKRKLTVE